MLCVPLQYKYEHCLEIRGAQTQIKPCPHCLQKNKIVPLLKEIVTSTGNKKNYPLVVYPSISLIFVYNLYCLGQTFITSVNFGVTVLKQIVPLFLMCIVGNYGKISCALKVKIFWEQLTALLS